MLKKINKELVSYLVFGLLTTLVSIVTFEVANLILGQDLYLLSNIISWIFAVTFAFVTNKLWVFDSKSWTPSVAGREFASFIGARLFSFAIETAMMFVFVSLFSMNDLIAKIIVGIVVIIINYVFSKLIIFKKK